MELDMGVQSTWWNLKGKNKMSLKSSMYRWNLEGPLKFKFGDNSIQPEASYWYNLSKI